MEYRQLGRSGLKVSALTLGTAAVLTGTDQKKIVDLPSLSGGKNEVIIQKSHRFGLASAIRSELPQVYKDSGYLVLSAFVVNAILLKCSGKKELQYEAIFSITRSQPDGLQRGSI